MPIAQVPQSVSVIGRQEMNDRGVTNKVDEALRYTPGVTTQPFGNDGDTDWFYIRGFDATQTGVFMNGLTLYSYGFGGFQIDPFMLERVEVLKGPPRYSTAAPIPAVLLTWCARSRPTIPIMTPRSASTISATPSWASIFPTSFRPTASIATG